MLSCTPSTQSINPTTTIIPHPPLPPPRRLCHPIEQPPAALSPRAATPGSSTGPSAPVHSAGADTLYRLASAGQDCQLLLWDVEVSEDTLAAVPSGLRCGSCGWVGWDVFVFCTGAL